MSEYCSSLGSHVDPWAFGLEKDRTMLNKFQLVELFTYEGLPPLAFWYLWYPRVGTWLESLCSDKWITDRFGFRFLRRYLPWICFLVLVCAVFAWKLGKLKQIIKFSLLINSWEICPWWLDVNNSSCWNWSCEQEFSKLNICSIDKFWCPLEIQVMLVSGFRTCFASKTGAGTIFYSSV